MERKVICNLEDLIELSPKELRKELGLLALEGLWEIKHVREGKVIYEEIGKNLLPYEGLNYVLDSALKGGAQHTSWYCSLFKNNITPALTDTANAALGSSGSYGEVTDSDVEPTTNRPQVIWGTITDGVVDNSDNRCEFTCVATSLTVYGGFVTTTQPKLDNTGILLSAKRFSTARTLLQDDILYVVVRIVATSS